MERSKERAAYEYDNHESNQVGGHIGLAGLMLMAGGMWALVGYSIWRWMQ